VIDFVNIFMESMNQNSMGKRIVFSFTKHIGGLNLHKTAELS